MNRHIRSILRGVFVCVWLICIAMPAYANELGPHVNPTVPSAANKEAVSTKATTPNPEPPVEMDSGAVAVVPTNKFDFGAVYDGNDVFHDFIVKNGGTSTLKIINVKSG